MRHAILALLANAPRHGYELKQALEDTFGDAMPALNIGQVYTTLSRLERDGLVLCNRVQQDGRPDKKVYEVTAAGRDELRDWIAAPAEGPRLRDEFFTKLVLARLPGVNGGMDPHTLIARQRVVYMQALRDLNEIALRGDRNGNAAASLLAEGAILHVQADLKWLDLCEQRLIQGV